ncbi:MULTISPECIES: hypothetical protein [Halobacterium]|uniref:hypothetical protein n=1 Tax=Halobacterium TaxID=2239 RepID=UPI00073E1A1A|nr:MULTISPECIES: hypothetical protein [Halobacterium]MCG1001880.1 hypothetical protein [Halobacterium noricense]
MNAIETRSTNESPEIIKSARYLDSCGLHTKNHKVRQAFVDVLEHVDDLSDKNVSRRATGCGACTPDVDADILLTWIAQGSATETMFVNYPDKEAAELVLEAADDLGVESSWTGETKDCVVLGDDGFYA